MNKRFLFILIFSIGLFLCQTVVYSAISSTMSISGSSIARVESDVRITNLKVSEKYNTGAVSNYEVFTKNSMSVSFNLNDSGKIYYDIEVSNYTNNMIGIQNISGVPEGVSYSFENYIYRNSLMEGIGSKVITICFTGSPGVYSFTINFTFKNKYTINFVGFEKYMASSIEVFEGGTYSSGRNAGAIKNIFVRKSDNTIYKDYTFTEDNFSILNIKSDLTVTNSDSFVYVKSGNIHKKNSEVCLGDECFYIVNSDNTSVRLFAKYNLYVGRDWDGENSHYYGDEATGIQHPEMRGYIGSGLVRRGVVAFISNMWWTDSITEYPAYVYDERSLHYNHLQNYKTYLENNDAIINDIRLISYEELVELGCRPDLEKCKGYSEEWVYYTSYWTGSADNNDSTKNLWAVFNDGGKFFTNTATNVSGVRPLIEIKYSDLL